MSDQVRGFGAGTTGGAGGPVIEVSTASGLLAAIRGAGPRIVLVNGPIAVPPGMHKVGSDTTVQGVGADAAILGGGLSLSTVHNVIIQNLRFAGASIKAIDITRGTHHVWIDHNELSTADDGLVDIKRGASLVTVSGNHLHDHRKSMLLGHDDLHTEDIGRLRVTYHHNFFDGTRQRHPRARFGNPVHVVNNYYLDCSDIGIAAQTGSGVLVEANYFEGVDRPMSTEYAGPPGALVERDNVYVDCGRPEPGGVGTVDDPYRYYSFTPDPASAVKDLVLDGAGVGRVPVRVERPVVRTGRPENYARRYHRTHPRPPADLPDRVTESLGRVPRHVIDLGAGTGLSTSVWRGRAGRVTAVEPDARLRAVLSREYPWAELRGCRAEDLDLPDGCADVLVAWDAAEWFTPEHPVLRLLCPGGLLIVGKGTEVIDVVRVSYSRVT
ncbi:methyltransferase domain-containing protein [Pseudonocardiaceae bacterium YIM PH 21723]|nr:methyltransferase domain-containing protein [Pseudonocardiaceae bacterium YIM PH 21723]